MSLNLQKAATETIPHLSLHEVISDLITSISVICQAKGIQLDLVAKETENKKINSHEATLLRTWIPKIIKILSDNSHLKIDSLEHDKQSYFLISFPVVDVLNDPWDQRQFLLSHLLSELAQQLPYTVRYHNQGRFSGFTLKFKLSAK